MMESFFPTDEGFAAAGVERALVPLACRSPEEVGRGLVEAAARHRERREADEDITLIVGEVTPQDP